MDIAAVLTLRYSSSAWILEGDTYETLTWLSDSTKPEQEELEALWPEIQEEIQARQQAKIDAKDSLRSKLVELGLTEEEIAAL